MIDLDDEPRAQHGAAVAAMHERAEAVRARAAVRKWEYRQRHLAHGVWFRWRLLLAYAAEAWAVSEDAVAALIAAGYEAEALGAELQPPRTIIRIRRADLPDGATPLTVRLDPAMLAAPRVVLVPFDDAP